MAHEPLLLVNADASRVVQIDETVRSDFSQHLRRIDACLCLKVANAPLAGPDLVIHVIDGDCDDGPAAPLVLALTVFLRVLAHSQPQLSADPSAGLRLGAGYPNMRTRCETLYVLLLYPSRDYRDRMRDTTERPWGVAQRFEFIEWRVFWNGRLNRGDLEREFNISTPQASVDLRNYQEAAPRNIEYDSSEKAYVATRSFRPQFMSSLSSERYLRQLLSIKVGAAAIEDTWFDRPPPVDLVRNLARTPEAYVLEPVVRAIRLRRSISINYRSLTNARVRVICPHTLAHDGYRWHVRAWCVERQEFRDFVLGRILSPSQPEPTDIHPPEDVEWETFTNLVLVPHPDLDNDQKETIARDFKMDNGRLEMNVRVALSFYFIRRYNLDLRDGQLTPERAQIYLENFDEVQAHCDATKKQAQELATEYRRQAS